MAISGSNRSFWIESSISPELRVDQSVSHSGALPYGGGGER